VARRWQNPERRLVLQPEAWPAADRETWARVSAQGDLLDEAGPAAAWSAVVRKKRLISYGRWLGFLARTGRLEVAGGELRDGVVHLPPDLSPGLARAELVSAARIAGLEVAP
jgi:hypothetical protein